MTSITLTSRPRRHVTIRSLVARPKGTWRWQDAYAVSSHALTRRRDGTLGWVMSRRSSKMSLPQIVRAGARYDYTGGLHQRPLTASEIPIMRSQLQTLIGGDRAARYERLACRLVRGLAQHV